MNSLLDFKGFKKVADDQEKATLQHPDGHQIHLVKSVISPKLRHQLNKLPLHQSSPIDAIPRLENEDDNSGTPYVPPVGQNAADAVAQGVARGSSGSCCYESFE